MEVLVLVLRPRVLVLVLVLTKKSYLHHCQEPARGRTIVNESVKYMTRYTHSADGSTRSLSSFDELDSLKGWNTIPHWTHRL